VSAYIQLAKHGDVVSILPALRADYLETGVRPKLLVSGKYSMIPSVCHFLETVVYTGDWNDLGGAIKFAKHHFGEFKTPQMHADGFQPRRLLPSFQLDQWARCGRLAQWGELPLVLPRVGNPIPGFSTTSKFIIFADASESSPFEHTDDLATALASAFPSRRILRLSTIQAPHLIDLVALYDAADLIVTVDTLHLHLSAASHTPVIALAADKPSRWHGSAFHPRMSLHVRYGDYLNRKAELIKLAWRLVNKLEIPVASTHDVNNENGYNLSMMEVGNNLWKTYRWHPGSSWRTELALSINGEDRKIILPEKYAKHSHEDARLFMFRGKPHISLTVARSSVTKSPDPCVTGYGRLSPDGVVHDWIEPRLGKNDWSSQEKNWNFFEWDKKLHVTYRHTPMHEVYELDGGRVVRDYKTKPPECSFGEPRGGTQPFPFRGEWLRFFHTCQVNKKSDAWWTYHVGALVMEAKPPFRIIKVSQFPIISGDELYYPGNKHWKPKVRIPYGAIETPEGWLVAMGANDSACETIELTTKMLHL
jgi:hypothetical protein